MEPHIKIIADEAKDILIKGGMIRIGRSRRYIADCGFFVIHTEFQPSGYDKGTYLNTGVYFLWDGYDFDEADIGWSYTDTVGGRISLDSGREYTSYAERGEELFREDVREFAIKARDCAERYRRFTDYSKGIRLLPEGKGTGRRILPGDHYEAALYCFLFSHYARGRYYLERAVSAEEKVLSMSGYKGVQWEKDRLARYKYELEEVFSDKQAAKNEVIRRVRITRERLSRRASYKGISPGFEFGKDK